MRKQIISAALCACLTLTSLFSLSGCGATVKAADLMDGITPSASYADVDISGKGAEAATDFAVKLFKQSAAEGENTLVSPLSVLCALAMTANGAKGETLAQMEKALLMPISQLNEYLHAYVSALPMGDKYKLSVANSIWFKDDDSFKVEESFLQSNADWYGAQLYKAPFDDSTLKDINSWVKENTDGMIEDIVDKIPDDGVMYLINALAFDAQWQDIYTETQVREGEFAKEDGTKQKAELMYSSEGRYLKDTNAQGFIKYYADEKYAFAALLPDEGVSTSDYIAELSGEKLRDMLENAQETMVNTAIPKFQSEYSGELNQILMDMGMTDAFDWTKADFSGIGSSTDGNLVINRVLHKTFIAVDEKGTKAGAATAVEMTTESAAPVEVKTVYLDRPFVYMIIDCQANIPVFIGAVTDIAQ